MSKIARQGINLERRTISAYHEAGHAVACVCLRVRIDGVAIHEEPEFEKREDGHVQHRSGVAIMHVHEDPTPEQAHQEACAMVAGCVAECILYSKQPGRGSSTDLTWLMIGATDDLVRATDHLRMVFEDSNMIGDALMEVRHNLENEWPRVRRIAQALLERGKLSFADVVALWDR